MAEHCPAGSETPPPYAPRSSRFGSALPSVEDDVDVWHYAILELHARNDDDGDSISYHIRRKRDYTCFCEKWKLWNVNGWRHMLCVQGDLVAVGILSGNRNFEGRINPLTRANYLASPPLVIAYALAGTVVIDFETEPLGKLLI